MPAQSQKGGGAILWISSLLIAVAAGFALGGLYVYHYYPHDNNAPVADGSGNLGAEIDKVVARGYIKPLDGILSLGVPTPDRIREIKVTEGDLVEAEKTLVVLDSEVLRELESKSVVIQSEQAEKRLQAITDNGEAQIRVEEIRRDQIKQLEPFEIKALKSKIEFLTAQEKDAQESYKHMLAVGDSIATQDKEKQKLARRQIETELASTQSQLAKLEKSSDINRSLADAQLAAARAELKQSQSAISLELLATQAKQAKERLGESQIRAPSKGKILRIFFHKGELVRGEPILQMANVDNMIVLAEVYETDIMRVKKGQKATISSRILTGKNTLTGRVVWKASSVAKAQTTPLDPRAAVDKRVVEVKIEVDQPGRVADLIDHQVDVAIDTKPTQGSH